MIRVRIWPQPSEDEAAAIESAIKALIARRMAGAKRLRYGDVVGSIAMHSTDRRGKPARPLQWRGLARLESLEPGV